MGRNPTKLTSWGWDPFILLFDRLEIHPSRGNRLGISAINTSRELTCPLLKAPFEDDVPNFPWWDMLVSWRANTFRYMIYNIKK